MSERYDREDETFVFELPNGFVAKLTGDLPCEDDEPTDQHDPITEPTTPVSDVDGRDCDDEDPARPYVPVNPASEPRDPEQGRISGDLDSTPPLPPPPPPPPPPAPTPHDDDGNDDECPSWLDRHRFLVGLILGVTAGFLGGTLWAITFSDNAHGAHPDQPRQDETVVMVPNRSDTPTATTEPEPTDSPAHETPPAPTVVPHTDPAPPPPPAPNPETESDPEPDPEPAPTGGGEPHPAPEPAPSNTPAPSPTPTSEPCVDCETPDQQPRNPFEDFICRVFGC